MGPTRSRQDYLPIWRSYFEAAGWLREHSGRESIVVARYPHLIHIVSERRAIHFLKSTDPEEVMAYLARYPDEFLVADSSSEIGKYFLPAVNAYPSRFELVYTTEAVPRTYILRLREGQRERSDSR